MAMDPKQLANAVSCWLNFESAIGREELFDESYMAYPIGAMLQVHSGGKVHLEEKHPVLATGGRGRQPSVDFVVKDNGGTTWLLAIESKFITDERSFAEEVFEDLLRLEALVTSFPAARRMLLLAGESERLRKLLTERTGQTGGGTAPLFPRVLSVDLASPSHISDLLRSAEPQRSYWKDSKPTAMSGWPETVETTLVGISGDLQVAGSYCCCVWEIRSPNRPLIQIP